MAGCRFARDHPDIWERMKTGEFKSVAAAAREAGISHKESGRVRLGNPLAVAEVLRQRFSAEELRQIADALVKDS